jgi:hypothetical protein
MPAFTAAEATTLNYNYPDPKEYRKYLINFDSATRSTATVKTYAAKYEQMPFDGMLVNALFVNAMHSVAQPVSTWFMSTYTIDWPSLATSLSDAQTTVFNKFSQNLLKLQVVVVSKYAIADWMSESIRAMIWNARMAARFARQAGYRGVFIDFEPDNTTATRKIFNYSDRPFASTYTFAQYKAKAKLVAQQMMEAFQDEYPNIRVVISFGYEQCIKENNPPIETDNYGLYASFLDGMFDARAGQCEIHNYFEDGYGHYDQANIDYDNGIQNAPNHNVLGTKYYGAGYHKGYSSFQDNLTNAQLAEGLPIIINDGIQRYSFIYSQAAPFMGPTGVPTATAATIAVVNAARVTVGFQTAFDPATIPNCIGNFNANNMTGFANNDPITSYTDSQGIVYTQSGSNRPLYKTSGIAANIPGVDFTAASSQSLICNALATALQGAQTSDIPFTVIMSAKLKTAGANYGLFGWGRSATTNPALNCQQASTNFLRLTVTDDAASSSNANADVTNTDTSAHIFTWIYSGTVVNMRQDGLDDIAAHYVTIDKGVMTLDIARIGARALNTPDLFADVVINRIAIYNQALGLDAVRWIELGMATETGVTVAGT